MPEDRNPQPERLRPQQEISSQPVHSPSRSSRPDRPDRPDQPQPPRSAVPPTPPGQPPQRPAPQSMLNRRSLLTLLGVGVAGAVIAPRLFRSDHPSLPEPSGQISGPEYREATLALKPAPTTPMPAVSGGWSSCAASATGKKLADLDLALVVDTTGSMASVLFDVKSNLLTLLSRLQAGGGSVRVGAVAYRDVGDSYVVTQTVMEDISGGARMVSSFLSSLDAAGGNDWPEKMDAAVQTALAMDWRSGVPGSLVVIADAPAHTSDQGAVLAAAKSFMRAPGRQVSLIDTGSGADPFMRAVPEAGGGQYVTYNGNILNSLYPAITACPNPPAS